MPKPSLLIKKRLVFLLLFFSSLIAVLVGRVAYIQIVKGQELQKEAFTEGQGDAKVDEIIELIDKYAK